MHCSDLFSLMKIKLILINYRGKYTIQFCIAQAPKKQLENKTSNAHLGKDSKKAAYKKLAKMLIEYISPGRNILIDY